MLNEEDKKFPLALQRQCLYIFFMIQIKNKNKFVLH